MLEAEESPQPWADLIVVLIPAYRPSSELLRVAEALTSSSSGLQLILVDDGSESPFQSVFEAASRLPRTHVVRHAVNLGKGAALKSGINAALTLFPGLVGVVTADADGQHHPDDIIAVAESLQKHPDAVVLGIRHFGRDVPFRNRIGNVFTRNLVRLLIGKRLTDTQTGLRALPRAVLPHLLRIPSSGYEFELDMLITLKHHGVEIRELPIRTIYDHPGQQSHFNPLFDSMRIYFVLMRFSAVSLLTAVLDNAVFIASYWLGGSIALSQILGRCVAVLFNYGAARSAVFLSNERHRVILPRYLALVLFSGLLSYSLIRVLDTYTALPVIWAKLLVESTLFLVNFAIQRDFVFTRKQSALSVATDWDHYYRSVPPTARLTRLYTSRVLTTALQRFAGRKVPVLAEIGGANSCFWDAVEREVQPGRMHIVDQNEYGLELLRRRLKAGQDVHLHQQDCRTMALPEPVDAVFSIGLIEHFDEQDTREATQAHLRLLRPGGVAVISFPTPTWLYRVARGITEALGLWKFPDERPLQRGEVLAAMEGQADLLWEKTLWPLVFTQHMVVARKRETTASNREHMAE